MDSGREARLRVHLKLIDDGVAPITDTYGAHMQCRPGCSECCQQTFSISAIEGELLREGLREAPAHVREAIVARAKVYEPDVRMPCPVLSEEGTCRLYAHRPRICRKYGIPLWHPDRPHEVRTCPKNFQDVGDIDSALIVDPQAQWAADWIRLREELGEPRDGDQAIAAYLRIPLD